MTNAMMNAMNVEQEPERKQAKNYFMECEVDHRQVVFVQVDGQWRLVDYDQSNPEHRDPDVEITFNFYGSTRDGSTYAKTYKMQARSRKRPDWRNIVLPSLKALGISDPPSQLHRHWIHFEAAPTGDTFISKTTGEQVERTAPKFLQVFDSKEACDAAAEAFWSERRNGSNGHNGQTKNVPQPLEKEHPQRAMLLTLLPAMWQAAQQQPDPNAAFQQMLEANPMMADADITMASDEVIDIITGILPY